MVNLMTLQILLLQITKFLKHFFKEIEPEIHLIPGSIILPMHFYQLSVI